MIIWVIVLKKFSIIGEILPFRKCPGSIRGWICYYSFQFQSKSYSSESSRVSNSFEGENLRKTRLKKYEERYNFYKGLHNYISSSSPSADSSTPCLSGCISQSCAFSRFKADLVKFSILSKNFCSLCKKRRCSA